MSRDVVTFGFSGDVHKIPGLGFVPGGVPAAPGSGSIVTLGFSRDIYKVVMLGFGVQALPPIVPTQLRQAVYNRLLASTAITDLVGARIYFGALPQSLSLDDGPALSYTVVTRTYGHVLQGADGTSQGRVQISSYAYTEQLADRIAQAVRDCWDGFRGFIGGLEVTACVLDNETDLSSPPAASTDQWLYMIASDYQVNHRVSLPSSLN
jgi:hypothetical protein